MLTTFLIILWSLVSAWVIFASSLILIHYGPDPVVRVLKKIFKWLKLLD